MALITCPECTREISDRAPSCPHCGYPLQEQLSGNSDINTQMPKNQKKPKRKLVILFSILACLIVGAAGCFAYILIAPRTEETAPRTSKVERVAKDKDFLYKWMAEHGTLIDGTVLEYSDMDAEGNKFTLCYDTHKVEQCRWYINFNSSESTVLPTTVLLTLFGDEKSEEVWITVTNGDGGQIRMAFYHSPETFTNNSTVELGNIYYTGESESRVDRILCQSRAHPYLCTILDWLKNSFCPTTDMTMADFGYTSYE